MAETMPYRQISGKKLANIQSKPGRKQKFSSLLPFYVKRDLWMMRENILSNTFRGTHILSLSKQSYIMY